MDQRNTQTLGQQKAHCGGIRTQAHCFKAIGQEVPQFQGQTDLGVVKEMRQAAE
jgi:hypothetical protein